MNYDTDRNSQLIYNYLVRKTAIQKRWIALFIFSMLGSYTEAQKLPNKQEVSVWASSNLKVNSGAATVENKFQAYNASSGIWYTVSNDGNNLYLIVKAPYRDAPDKILTGGLTLIISHYVDKAKRNSANDNASLRFPVLNFKESQSIIVSGHQYETLREDTINNKNHIDSLIKALNNKASNIYKTIEVTGLKDITDPELSVYNTEGIKAMAQFDSKMNYIYELSVPLKSLRLSTESLERFSYCIKINGRPEEKPLPGQKFGINEDAINPGSDYLYRMSDSIFWGEYTLAKKP